MARNNESSDRNDLNSAREYTVSLAWGELAIKEWGPKNGLPVLALHGWQDNAGSFDKLAPLLPPHIRLVCIDLPGHGLSSQYPPGMMYNFWDYSLNVKLLADYFQWQMFSIIGHSLGAIVGLVFAGLYPGMVEKLTTFDVIKPFTWPIYLQPDAMANALLKYQEAFKKSSNQAWPSYSYEEARDKLIKGHEGSLDNTAAEILMKRGTRHDGRGGYVFSRDVRHSFLNPVLLTREQQQEILQRMTCHLLIIKGKDGPVYESPEDYEAFMQETYVNCRSFKYVEVNGAHHPHLTNAEEVAPYIRDFFQVQSNL